MASRLLHGSSLRCRRAGAIFIGKGARHHWKPQGLPPDLGFHCGGPLPRLIAMQRLALCEGHRAGYERWGAGDHARKPHPILTARREGCRHISGGAITMPSASAHGGSDFDSGDTGELVGMHRGCGEHSDPPGEALLLPRAFANRATSAEGDGRFAAFLAERFGDEWPTDVHRGHRGEDTVAASVARLSRRSPASYSRRSRCSSGRSDRSPASRVSRHCSCASRDTVCASASICATGTLPLSRSSPKS
jgi:hypothetical protein